MGPAGPPGPSGATGPSGVGLTFGSVMYVLHGLPAPPGFVFFGSQTVNMNRFGTPFTITVDVYVKLTP